MPDLERGRGSERVHLHYEDSGSGPPLLLSHSWFCTGEQWPQVPDLVAAGYRVLNLDNRGHGRSGPCTDEYTLWDVADDLVAVLDHAGVDRAVLIGLSVGGFAAIRAVLGHPERVAALVLADTSADTAALRGRTKAALLSPVAGTRWGRPVALAAATDVLFGATTRREHPELVRRWREVFEGQDVDSMLTMLKVFMRREDLTDRLGEIRVPTLVVVGDEDEDPGVLASARIAARIPGARFAVLAEAGHLAALERPGEFGARLLEFLQDVVPART